jgi:hypothetical protein
MRKTLLMLLSVFLVSTGCGNGNGGDEDTQVDIPAEQPPDTTPDTTPDPSDDPVPDPTDEETPVEPYKACAVTCTDSASCCITTAGCGTYPDKWTCSGSCVAAGCENDPECVTWATAKGYPSAENYSCRSPSGGGTPRCVAPCSSPVDCCAAGTCDTFPNRWVCESGACFLTGCLNNEECVTWATNRGLHAAASYVCTNVLGDGVDVCAQSCTTAEDCCSPDHAPCTTLPNHFGCQGGICMLACSTDTECQTYAAGLPDPRSAQYVCREP